MPHRYVQRAQYSSSMHVEHKFARFLDGTPAQALIHHSRKHMCKPHIVLCWPRELARLTPSTLHVQSVHDRDIGSAHHVRLAGDAGCDQMCWSDCRDRKVDESRDRDLVRASPMCTPTRPPTRDAPISAAKTRATNSTRGLDDAWTSQRHAMRAASRVHP